MVARRRITFVAEQLLGHFRTGGLGTATTFFAVAFARMGHEVEVLYFGEPPSGPVDPEWATLYERAGVRITRVARSERVIEPSHFRGMRDIELALRANPPDVVIAQDLGAPTYSALCLRQLGLAFENTLFVVFCHGTRQWITNMARKVRVLPGALAVSRLERLGVELADIAVSPSAYMVEWMRGQGWQLPERTEVIPLLTRSIATGESAPEPVASNGAPVDRVVFFGRLEERKGVRPFVAALNALPTELLERFELEFVGRPTKAFAPARVQALLSETATAALRLVSFATDLDQHEALARLRRPGTLAVIPSLEDNSPNVVYECIELGIPFLASVRGGTRELITAQDRARVLFEPTAEGIAAALRRALESETVPEPAQPEFDGTVSLARWEQVLGADASHPKPARQHVPVDVVVVHRSSEAALARCLSALRAQTYLELREPIVAAAREDGLHRATAPWVIFLDENDLPAPELVEMLVSAQTAADADVVTCGVEIERVERLFSGNPAGLGLVGNDYGTVALLRRELLDGIASSRQVVGDADWPLLARLAAEGARVVSVPLPLVASTRRPGTIEREPSDALLVVEQLERALPDSARDLARLAAGLLADTHPPPLARPGFRRRVARRLAGRRA